MIDHLTNVETKIKEGEERVSGNKEELKKLKSRKQKTKSIIEKQEAEAIDADRMMKKKKKKKVHNTWNKMKTLKEP